MHQGSPHAGHYWSYARLGYENPCQTQASGVTPSAGVQQSSQGSNSSVLRLGTREFCAAFELRWGCFPHYCSMFDLAQVAADARRNAGTPMNRVEKQACVNACAEFLACRNGDEVTVSAVTTHLCSAEGALTLAAILYPSR
eukprot:COSAG01_NODE_25517_length_742_cov_0.811820_2_plen_141_part_00